MIIECSACQAKFRLDEERIKGKGVRVRCRKCGGYIVVMRPGLEEQPPPPPASDFLDLRSVIGESLAPSAESRVAPPPAAVPVAPTAAEIPEPPPVPGAAELPGPAVEAPSVPSPFAAPPAAVPDREGDKDEVDLAFEKFLSSGPDALRESPPEPLPPAPPPREATLEFAPEEKIEFAVAGPEEHTEPPPRDLLEPPPDTAPKPPERASAADFILGDTDSLDFLRGEEHKAGGRPEAPAASPDLDAVPLLSMEDTLRPPPPGAAESPPRAVEPPRSPGAGEDAGMLEPVELRPAIPPLEPPPEPVAAAARRASAPPEAPYHRRAPASRPVYARPGVIALVLVFLGLAGGGGYLGFTPGGQEQLKRIVPGIESLLGRGGAPAPGPSYDVRNLIGYLETGAGGGKLFVIKGQVANVGRAKKSGIRLKASLLDEKDRSVADRTVYAGNILTGDALRKTDRAKIDEALSNRFGDKFVNMDVQPGKAIPFMVVFVDPPEGVSAYRLEAVDGE